MAYDKASRLTSINMTSPRTSVHSYAYDNASRVTSFNTTGSGAATPRLPLRRRQASSRQRPAAIGESYAYDDNGNRVVVDGQSIVTGLSNRLASDGTYTYQYDNEGNLTKRTLNSNTTLTTEYAYDHRNRLMSVADKNGTTVVKSVTYTYDAQGRRVKRELDSDGSGPFLSNKQYFVYDSNGDSGDELSMRFDQLGTDSVELTHRYLSGPAVDQVLVDEVFTPGVNNQPESEEVLWLLSDQQGTVRDIVNSGSCARKHIDYDSFGRVTATQTLNGSAVDQLFYFQGQERDATTKLQKHGERWYSPDTGRWLNEDPIGFDAGDANLYRYVGNSPTNYIDPTGTTQAGNPLTNLFPSTLAGGYTGGSVREQQGN